MLNVRFALLVCAFLLIAGLIAGCSTGGGDQPQPQVAGSMNSPTPQINPMNTQHLASDQENLYGDEQVSFDQFNEARGDQS